MAPESGPKGRQHVVPSRLASVEWKGSLEEGGCRGAERASLVDGPHN